MKFIIITGGVISGLGKGVCSSSIGLLFKSLGYKVTAIKIDPYLNVDSGTLSPFEHGEVYVLRDSGEADLDLGNYERFLSVNLTKEHSITTGKIYTSVLQKERNGEYLGQTVQVVPHIVSEIQDSIIRASQIDVGDGTPDICMVELGGVCGDIELSPFAEALAQLSQKVGKQNVCFVHVSLIIDMNGENKTKPTQHGIRTLRSLGIVPDLLILRTKDMLDNGTLGKININCGVVKDHIIQNTNVPNIYYVPDLFKRQGVCEKISTVLGLDLKRGYQLDNYYGILHHFNEELPVVKVGIVGKYVGSNDTYLSLVRAVEHASFAAKCHAEIVWIDAEKIEKGCTLEWDKLKRCDRVIIAGGFGSRGTAGKQEVCKYCRVNNVKILGICLGFQLMAIEYACSLGYNANSREWSSDGFGLIHMIPDQNGVLGGTMRLGDKTSVITDDVIKGWYGSDKITERHRHRYELTYINAKVFEESDMVCSAVDLKNELVEIVRLKNHPFYVGCQFHPEFISRYEKGHPLFVNLLM